MKTNNEALKRIISKFEAQWQAEASFAIERLYNLMDNGMKADAAIRKLQQEFPQIFKLSGIREALIEAAAHGYGIMPSVLTSADRQNIMNVIEQPWSADGMKLSQKLHAYNDVLYNTILNTVQEQVRKNATAIQISRQLYDGYNSGNDRLQRGRFTEDQRLPKYINQIKRLQNATIEDSKAVRIAAANIERLAKNGAPNRALKAGYSKLLKAVEGNNEKAIQNAINVAVNEKSRYLADRIARTEMARAYADGFFSRHNNDADVIGYEYELSTRHPCFDVCDMYANSNMFNLGKGVYPKDKVPIIPVHPHCLCTYSVLYKGQIDLSRQRNQQHSAIAKWIGNLDERQAIQVLGRDGYAAYKASKTPSNASNSRTNSNIATHANKYSYERYIRNYNGLGNPQYREINLFEASKNRLQKGSMEHIIKEINKQKRGIITYSLDLSPRPAKDEIIPVNSTYYNLNRNVQNLKKEGNYYDIICHGNPTSLEYDTTNKRTILIGAEQLAEIVKNMPDYKGEPIRMIVCQAGKLDNGIAAQLSKALGVEVKAPTEKIRVSEKGEIFITDSDILADMWDNGEDVKPTGKWRIFGRKS